MWKAALSNGMIKLNYFMKHNYLLCPCQGQYIEGGIKDAVIMGQVGVEEKRRNELAIIWSHTLSAADTLAHLLQIHKNAETKDPTPARSELTASFISKAERKANKNLSGEETETLMRLLEKINLC